MAGIQWNSDHIFGLIPLKLLQKLAILAIFIVNCFQWLEILLYNEELKDIGNYDLTELFLNIF